MKEMKLDRLRMKCHDCDFEYDGIEGSDAPYWHHHNTGHEMSGTAEYSIDYRRNKFIKEYHEARLRAEKRMIF